MAISAEHRSKFAALHRQWWRLQMSEKFTSGTKKKPSKKQTNKQLKPLSFLESHTYCDTEYLTPVAERFAVELSLLDSMI